MPERHAHGGEHQPKKHGTHPKTRYATTTACSSESFDRLSIPLLTALGAARLTVHECVPTRRAHNPGALRQLSQTQARNHQPSDDGQEQQSNDGARHC
jgi:hypothetical protein